jgi:hypothetical protein
MPLDVRFEAAGKPYRLCFSANALCALEEATGAGVDALGATLQDEKGKRLSLVRSVLWAGLQEHHAAEVKTVHDAGRVIDAVGFDEAVSLIAKGFGVALPGNPPPVATAG